MFSCRRLCLLHPRLSLTHSPVRNFMSKIKFMFKFCSTLKISYDAEATGKKRRRESKASPDLVWYVEGSSANDCKKLPFLSNFTCFRLCLLTSASELKLSIQLQSLNGSSPLICHITSTDTLFGRSVAMFWRFLKVCRFFMEQSSKWRFTSNEYRTNTKASSQDWTRLRLSKKKVRSCF